MLILLEPCLLLVDRIYAHYHQPFVFIDEYGTEASGFAINTQGGLIIAVGLITYCIALVFHYGIALQNQVDETL